MIAYLDDGKRPIDMGKAFCFRCMEVRTFQLNSNGSSYVAEYECKTCGHKTDLIVRE